MGSADKRRLRRKLDILDVESYAAMRQHIWYGGSSRKTYNDVDRGFYESIINKKYRNYRLLADIRLHKYMMKTKLAEPLQDY